MVFITVTESEPDQETKRQDSGKGSRSARVLQKQDGWVCVRMCVGACACVFT